MTLARRRSYIASNSLTVFSFRESKKWPRHFASDGAQIADIAVLELGRQIAIDLKADADFDERRSGPGHDCFLSVCHEVEVSISPVEAKALLPIVRTINGRGQHHAPRIIWGICPAMRPNRRTRPALWPRAFTMGSHSEPP
jgi:hypothetical protein